MQAEEVNIDNEIHREGIMSMVEAATVEVTPGGAKKIEDFNDILRKGTTVYVTFLPGSDFNSTVEVVARLRKEGMVPVPHIAARSLPDKAFLENILKTLTAEAGVEEVLLIGGGVDKPLGDFNASIEVLQTGLFEKYGIKKAGLAGHPEGSPDISDALIAQALAEKNAYADSSPIAFYIATQFCFTASPVIDWAYKIATQGNKLPIRVGVPGLATIKTLLKHAQQCGIGPSMRVLTKQSKNMANLLKNHSPGRLINDLAKHKIENPDSIIEGIHWYPLGGLRKTMLWAEEVRKGQFALTDSSGTGSPGTSSEAISVQLPE